MAHGKIKFENGGEIALLANALTKYRFRQIFGLDLMDELEGMEESSPGHVCEIFEMLTYTMMLQAKKEAEKGSIDDFFIWLEDISAYEIADHLDDILAVYQGNLKSTIEPKNPDGPQNAE